MTKILSAQKLNRNYIFLSGLNFGCFRLFLELNDNYFKIINYINAGVFRC